MSDVPSTKSPPPPSGDGAKSPRPKIIIALAIIVTLGLVSLLLWVAFLANATSEEPPENEITEEEMGTDEIEMAEEGENSDEPVSEEQEVEAQAEGVEISPIVEQQARVVDENTPAPAPESASAAAPASAPAPAPAPEPVVVEPSIGGVARPFTDEVVTQASEIPVIATINNGSSDYMIVVQYSENGITTHNVGTVSSEGTFVFNYRIPVGAVIDQAPTGIVAIYVRELATGRNVDTHLVRVRVDG